MESDSLVLLVKWKSSLFSFDCSDSDSVLSLKLKIQEETHVVVEKQKLSLRFGKPKPADVNDALLGEIIVPKNRTLLLVGTPEEDLFKAPSLEDQKKLLPSEEAEEEAKEDRFKPVNLAKMEARKETIKIKVFNEPRKDKKLLVLDIDYTLFDHRSSAEQPGELMRPYLHEFLTSAYENYDIIIWSATSVKWIDLKMTQLGVMSNPNYKIVCFFDYSAMITVKSERYGLVNVKPLPVLWHFFPDFYHAGNTIMFDDIKRNFLMNPQNGLRIVPFRNAHQLRSTDRELLRLQQYLSKIAPLPSLVHLRHSKWKTMIEEELE